MKEPSITLLTLPTQLKATLASGHPWIYRNHIVAAPTLPDGSWLRLRCGDWNGFGIWDTEGPIAIRIFSTQQLPDEAWFEAQLRLAWSLRTPLFETCTAYRWVFGEGDGLPGLTVDRYGDYAVIMSYSRGVATLVPMLVQALLACDPSLKGILGRKQATDEEQDQPGARITVLWGQPAPDDLVVIEDGLRFAVDLERGQKTGLFLDQRENRRFIESLSAGRRVLNVFAYTGAFSLYALRGGAERVVSVDIGNGLAEAAAHNIRLSGLNSARHSFLTEDAFTVLEHYVNQGQLFDLVILDPPSFARRKQNRHAALRAYTRLNALGMRCVAAGGFLASASCTSQVGPEAFREMLAAAATAAGRRMQIIHEAGQPCDHPVPAHFPEGRYLKFVVGRLTNLP